MMKSKIHRATVTEADLNYVGSITIDSDLLKAVDILPNEKVLVVNNNNGERFETYAIEGKLAVGRFAPMAPPHAWFSQGPRHHHGIRHVVGGRTEGLHAEGSIYEPGQYDC